ncbi:MAG: VanZ family protein [Bacteroidales bacterium]|jgi:VanZ family protein|nr:VanZ family protein [Bacteroidales bacterium]
MKYPYFLFSILSAGVIFFLCNMQLPDETPPEFQIPNFDKLVHFLMYFGLTGMLYVDYFKLYQAYSWKQVCVFVLKSKRGAVQPLSVKPFILLAILSLAYGGGIEIFQYYCSPFRTGDVNDFFADLCGVSLAFAVAAVYYRKVVRFT